MSISNIHNGKIPASNTTKSYNLSRNQLGSSEIDSVFSKYDKDGDGKLNSCNKNGVNELEDFLSDYENNVTNVENNTADSNTGNVGSFEQQETNPLKKMYDGVKKFLSGEQSTDAIYRDGEAVEANGVLEDNQQGSVGNCWMLSELNAGKNTKFGKDAINGSISKNTDGSYTVNLKGVNKSYTFTAEEIQAAIDGEKYSEGDLDYLLLEMAFEKHYDEALSQVAEDDMDYSKDIGNKLPSRSIEGGGHVYPRPDEEVQGSPDAPDETPLDSDKTQEDVHPQNEKGGYNDKDLYGLLGTETYREAIDQPDLLQDKTLTEDILSLKREHPESVAITFGSSYNIETGEDFGIEGHAYSIENVNKQEDGTLEADVRNPWDNSKSIPRTTDDITIVADRKLEIITDDKSIQEKTNKLKKDSYQRIYNQKFYDENSTMSDLIIEPTYVDTKGLVSDCGGMKNYMDIYMNKCIKDPDLQGMTQEDLKTLAKNTYEDSFGFSAEDAKDCAEHPEKLEQYCNKYGYQY